MGKLITCTNLQNERALAKYSGYQNSIIFAENLLTITIKSKWTIFSDFPWARPLWDVKRYVFFTTNALYWMVFFLKQISITKQWSVYIHNGRKWKRNNFAILLSYSLHYYIASISMPSFLNMYNMLTDLNAPEVSIYDEDGCTLTIWSLASFLWDNGK